MQVGDGSEPNTFEKPRCWIAFNKPPEAQPISNIREFAPGMNLSTIAAMS
jgi:hypothetical protein